MQKTLQHSFLHGAFKAAVLCLCVQGAWAMSELEDSSLSTVTGEGIAIVLTDVALKMGPTSYVELTGTDEAAGGERNYRRGDLRWYGQSYTSSNPALGQAWSGACSNGILNLGCPLGGTIAKLAPHDNPIVLRAFDYVGTLMDGTTNQTRSVFEVLFPSRHEPYRYAFWGEMNVGTGSTVGTGNTAASTIGLGGDKLQVQNIWSNIDQGGTIVRLFQTSDLDPNERTFGMQFVNRFAANIRMSVAQTLFSPDTLGQTPEFDDTEGLYMGDYRIAMSVGQLHYQALVFDDVPAKDGNFQIKLTQLPNIPAVYNEFYGRTLASDPTGGYDRTKFDDAGDAGYANYNKSHAFVRMGDYAPTQQAVAYNPPAFGAVNAPTTNMGGEVAACMADRPLCSHGSTAALKGNNTPYDITDGVFFVAAPGETFRVFSKSPNYMWDGNVDSDQDTGAAPNMNPLNDAGNPNNAVIPVGTNARLDLTRINLGDVNIQGMVVHSLSLTTLGAQ